MPFFWDVINRTSMVTYRFGNGDIGLGDVPSKCKGMFAKTRNGKNGKKTTNTCWGMMVDGRGTLGNNGSMQGNGKMTSSNSTNTRQN